MVADSVRGDRHPLLGCIDARRIEQPGTDVEDAADAARAGPAPAVHRVVISEATRVVRAHGERGECAGSVHNARREHAFLVDADAPADRALLHVAIGAARSLFTGRGIWASGRDMFIVGFGVAAAGYVIGELITRLL